MKIGDILTEDLVLASLRGRTKNELIEELARVVSAHRAEIDHDRLVEALEERERLNSTALGEGVAIPHGKLPGLKQVVAAFGRSLEGVDFQSLDGKPTHLFFLLVAPEDSAGAAPNAPPRLSRPLAGETLPPPLLGSPSPRGPFAQ